MGESGVMWKFLIAVVVILSLSVFSSAQAVGVTLRRGEGDFVTIAHLMQYWAGVNLPWISSRVITLLLFRFPGSNIRSLPMQSLLMNWMA